MPFLALHHLNTKPRPLDMGSQAEHSFAPARDPATYSFTFLPDPWELRVLSCPWAATQAVPSALHSVLCISLFSLSHSPLLTLQRTICSWSLPEPQSPPQGCQEAPSHSRGTSAPLSPRSGQRHRCLPVSTRPGAGPLHSERRAQHHTESRAGHNTSQ